MMENDAWDKRVDETEIRLTCGMSGKDIFIPVETLLANVASSQTLVNWVCFSSVSFL